MGSPTLPPFVSTNTHFNYNAQVTRRSIKIKGFSMSDDTNNALGTGIISSSI